MPLLTLDRRAPVRSRRFDADGRLHVRNAPLTRVGVVEYLGREIPGNSELGLNPHRRYRMLRTAEALRKAAPSVNGLPLLSQHVSSEDPHDQSLVVGCVGSDAHFDGEFLTASVVVWAKNAIDLIESGECCQLSIGWFRHPAEAMEPGWFCGSRYDGKLEPLEAHHLALVARGRAGSECSL